MLARDIAAAAKDDREARLPKWAQDKLERMRHMLADATALAEQARLATDPEGSSVLIHRHGDEPIGLGDATIEYRTGGGRLLVYVDKARAGVKPGEAIQVQGYDGRLTIEPASSNTIIVRNVPWFTS